MHRAAGQPKVTTRIRLAGRCRRTSVDSPTGRAGRRPRTPGRGVVVAHVVPEIDQLRRWVTTRSVADASLGDRACRRTRGTACSIQARPSAGKSAGGAPARRRWLRPRPARCAAVGRLQVGTVGLGDRRQRRADVLEITRRAPEPPSPARRRSRTILYPRHPSSSPWSIPATLPRPPCHDAPPMARTRRLHRSRRATGPTVVLVHGFTQTEPLVAADRRRPRPRSPGHPGRCARPRSGRPTCTRTSGTAPGCSARPVARPPTSGTRWGAGSACISRSANPSLVKALVLIGATAGLDDPHRTGRPPSRRRSARPAPRGRRSGAVPHAVAGPTAVRRSLAGRRRPRSPPTEHRRRSRLVAAPGGDRHPGSAAVGPAGRVDHARARRRRRA